MNKVIGIVIGVLVLIVLGFGIYTLLQNDEGEPGDASPTEQVATYTFLTTSENRNDAELSLSESGGAVLVRENVDGTETEERGTWTATADGQIEVVFTKDNEGSFEEPRVIVFDANRGDLVAVEYDESVYGAGSFNFEADSLGTTVEEFVSDAADEVTEETSEGDSGAEEVSGEGENTTDVVVEREENGLALRATYAGENTWNYTISGTLPTPCFETGTDVAVDESLPEQVTVTFEATPTGEVCVQVIEEIEETGTFSASAEAEVTFSATIGTE